MLTFEQLDSSFRLSPCQKIGNVLADDLLDFSTFVQLLVEYKPLALAAILQSSNTPNFPNLSPITTLKNHHIPSILICIHMFVFTDDHYCADYKHWGTMYPYHSSTFSHTSVKLVTSMHCAIGGHVSSWKIGTGLAGMPEGGNITST